MPGKYGRRAGTAPYPGQASANLSWLIDTDVICQPAKRRGDPRVNAWLHQDRDRCFTSAIVVAQLAYWVQSKEGRQRRELQDWLRRLVDALGGHVLGFNVSVAHMWADQEHLLERQGVRMPVEDGYLLLPRDATELRS